MWRDCDKHTVATPIQGDLHANVTSSLLHSDHTYRRLISTTRLMSAQHHDYGHTFLKEYTNA
jgi:hypothetical protein